MTTAVAYATRRVEWSPGVTVNVRMAASLRRVEDRLGYDLTIIQGCYHAGVGPSAGTHDHGGAVDLAPFDWPQKVRAMRLEGWAAWHRPPIPGLWNEHVHCMMIGDPDIPPGSLAAEQVAAYYLGFDGLGYMGRGGYDTGPRFVPIPQTPLEMEDFVPYADWSKKDKQALLDDVAGAVLRSKAGDVINVPADSAYGKAHKSNPTVTLATGVEILLDQTKGTTTP